MSNFNKNAVYLLNRMTAEKIDAKMRTVRSGRKKYERSWIWELIQNAKDKATIDFPNEKVSIFVELTDNQFTFSHNFGYFTMQNVEGLIRQTNTEDKDREAVLVENTQINPTIGRFGTGFMTTHLLSEKVQVKGLYREENSFKKVDFSLDRSSTERNELVESVNTSFEQAEGSLKNSQIVSNPNFSDYNTVFTYHLDEYSRKTAQTGLDDLAISLPFTLIFVDGIKQLKIIQGTEQTLYEKKEPQTLYNEVKLIEIDKIVNGQVEKLHYVFLIKNLTRIALQVEIKNDTFHIKDFAEKLPYIFLHYPLIGTEKFYFPVIVNNPFFEPTEPRDGIYILDDTKDEKSITDQNFIIEAVDLFRILLPYAVANNWQNLYNLAKTDLPSQDEDYFAKSWFKTNIQKPLRSSLLKSEIVQTETSRILLENALFPYNSSESKITEIWDLAKVLHNQKLPKLEHIKFWYQIIDSTWDKELRYDLIKMVTEIATFENLSNLLTRTNLTENETLIWLNSVIQFVVSEDEKLLTEFAIIPNQYGTFKKSEELWADDNVPRELKDVLKTLENDWRLRLQHNQITSYEAINKKGIDDSVELINKIIEAKANVTVIRKAVLELLSCFPNDDNLSKERHLFWKFAKEFYPNTPGKKVLENWISTVWKECDKFFMRFLTFDISQKQTVVNLTTHLNSDSLLWLHEFVIFISNQRFETHLNDYAILPDQKGIFKKKRELSVDDEIDNSLKDILEGLGSECRSELLATEIMLDIEGKIQSSKDIANRISDKVNQIYKTDLGRNREESIKIVFAKLFQWFHYNPAKAKEWFSEIYEKRSLILRTDDENIADIEFKQLLLDNQNGYTEEEILNLVNTPKNQLYILSENELNELVEKRLAQSNDTPINPQDLIVSLGIASLEELELAKQEFAGTKIGETLQHLSKTTDFSYVHQIIERAKKNVKDYLSTQPNYNISNWKEESFTVISGILKNDREIKLVIRPADNGQIIIYYQNEFETLEKSNAELWYDNESEQGIYSFGRFLKKAKISRMPI
jgi:hypothetical protein